MSNVVTLRRDFAARKLALYDAMTLDPELSPVDCRVAWRILTRMAENTGRSWLSIMTLASEVGIDRRTVFRSIRRLVDGGYLLKDAGLGRGHASSYGLGNPGLQRMSKATPFRLLSRGASDRSQDRRSGFLSAALDAAEFTQEEREWILAVCRKWEDGKKLR